LFTRPGPESLYAVCPLFWWFISDIIVASLFRGSPIVEDLGVPIYEPVVFFFFFFFGFFFSPFFLSFGFSSFFWLSFLFFCLVSFFGLTSLASSFFLLVLLFSGEEY